MSAGAPPTARSRNPLDRLPSLKLRLGLLIVLAIGVTLVTMLAAGLLDVPLRVGALAALVLSLGTVQVVARGTTRPLQELRAAAGRLAAREAGVRVTVRGRDEVAELGHAFNRMAAELDETERIRRDLVADAAHELRTPVAALAAVLENDLDGVQPADTAALLDQVRRLGALADRLLDLSRLDAGAAEPRIERVVVRGLVDRPVDVLDVPPDLVVRGTAGRPPLCARPERRRAAPAVGDPARRRRGRAVDPDRAPARAARRGGGVQRRALDVALSAPGRSRPRNAEGPAGAGPSCRCG